jgi:hypothetical protein
MVSRVGWRESIGGRISDGSSVLVPCSLPCWSGDLGRGRGLNPTTAHHYGLTGGMACGEHAECISEAMGEA